MKISEFVISLGKKHGQQIVLVKKGMFWVAINEQAFFLSKIFGCKLTILDKNSIKIGFPDTAKKKWLEKFSQKNIGYVLYIKENSEYLSGEKYIGKDLVDIYPIDLEDYTLTLERILKLRKMGLKEEKANNFLLKDKLEEIYFLFSTWVLKFPKKQRYFIREKIERLFFELLEEVYSYMYNIGDRSTLIKTIFNKVLVLREFTRILYKMGKIGKETFYLDVSSRWVEVMKICKGIMKKK